MKLITKELEKRFRLIGRQEIKNPIVVCRFFAPWNNWSRYATEYYQDSGTFFGYVVGHFPERGYFSLEELESARGPYGLKIERDLHFEESFFLNI